MNVKWLPRFLPWLFFAMGSFLSSCSDSQGVSISKSLDLDDEFSNRLTKEELSMSVYVTDAAGVKALAEKGVKTHHVYFYSDSTNGSDLADVLVVMDTAGCCRIYFESRMSYFYDTKCANRCGSPYVYTECHAKDLIDQLRTLSKMYSKHQEETSTLIDTRTNRAQVGLEHDGGICDAGPYVRWSVGLFFGMLGAFFLLKILKKK